MINVQEYASPHAYIYSPVNLAQNDYNFKQQMQTHFYSHEMQWDAYCTKSNGNHVLNNKATVLFTFQICNTAVV